MEGQKRLIELGEALRMVQNSRSDCPETSIKGRAIWETAHNCALSCLTNCPTVDAAEVVRCKDCKCWSHVENGIGNCSNGRFHLDGHADPSMNADDFCSCGERRDCE